MPETNITQQDGKEHNGMKLSETKHYKTKRTKQVQTKQTKQHCTKPNIAKQNKNIIEQNI